MENILSVNTALAIHEYTQPLLFASASGFILLVLLTQKRTYDARIFVVAFLITFGVVWSLKHFFAIARPETALIKLPDYAFPSSHAALSACIATVVGWSVTRHKRIKKRYIYSIKTVVFFPAFVIGISRLTIGVHTPLQVFVGFMIGICIPLLTIYIAKRF